jgi:hypothetical protein
VPCVVNRVYEVTEQSWQACFKKGVDQSGDGKWVPSACLKLPKEMSEANEPQSLELVIQVKFAFVSKGDLLDSTQPELFLVCQV